MMDWEQAALITVIVLALCLFLSVVIVNVF